MIPDGGGSFRMRGRKLALMMMAGNITRSAAKRAIKSVPVISSRSKSTRRQPFRVRGRVSRKSPAEENESTSKPLVRNETESASRTAAS